MEFTQYTIKSEGGRLWLVLSTAYRSACVFLQADCPQIHHALDVNP